MATSRFQRQRFVFSKEKMIGGHRWRLHANVNNGHLGVRLLEEEDDLSLFCRRSSTAMLARSLVFGVARK